MTTHDAFAEKFRKLIREIPDDTTLPQWQFVYRQAIVVMGLHILERFQRDAVGSGPMETRSAGGGHGPGDTPPPPVAGGPWVPGGPPGGGGGVTESTGSGGHGTGGNPSLVIAGVALGLQPVPSGKRS